MMLKESLSKLGSEFGFLAETEIEQNIMNRLDRSVKLDEVDTITFGLETDDGKIVKVYVKVDEADDFEKALATKLGEIDDIEEVLNELSKEYEIVDVEWPSEDPTGDEDETEIDGSDSLNKKVYDNKNEKAEEDSHHKPKLEGLSFGERFTIELNEGTESIESRFTTAAQLMVYHAILELGIPEVALSRGAYRAVIIKNIKEKAIELTRNGSMKNALKIFINRSIDYDAKAKKNETAIGKDLKDSKDNIENPLNEGLTQDFWDTFLTLVNYVAATPEDAKVFLGSPALKQVISRSNGVLSSKVTSQLKTKLKDFKTSLTSDGGTNQLKVMGVAESYLKANEKLIEGSTPAEITDLFKSLLLLADESKDGIAVNSVLKSSTWNKFFNAARGSLTQKFSGPARAKLDQLKAVLPKTEAPVPATGVKETPAQVESKKLFRTAIGEEKSLKNATLAHAYQYGSEMFDEGHPIEVIGEDGDSYIVKPFPIMAHSHMKLKKSAVKLTGKINVPDGGPGGKMPGGLNEAFAIKKANGTWVKEAPISSIGPNLSAKGKIMTFTTKAKADSWLTVAGNGKFSKNFVDAEIVKAPANLYESQVPVWTFDQDDENVVIQCATLKVILNDEELEKLIKGISNKDTVIVRDEEDPTHKVAFSPRGSSVMVKKVGTPDGIMMKQGDVDDLLDFVSKGDEPDKPKDEEAPSKEEPDDVQPAGGDDSAVPKDQVKESKDDPREVTGKNKWKEEITKEGAVKFQDSYPDIIAFNDKGEHLGWYDGTDTTGYIYPYPVSE